MIPNSIRLHHCILIFIYVLQYSNASTGLHHASIESTPNDLRAALEKGITLSKTGTTIVGMCCRDGVVLGADTRSTGGPLVIDKEKLKIHPLSPRIFCCAAGTSADCDQITRCCSQMLSLQRIEHELSGEPQYLDSVYFAVSNIMDLFQKPVGNRLPESAMILGGVDHMGPSLYHLTKDGAQRTTFCALGSGSMDAISVLESARRKWGKPILLSFRDGLECLQQSVEDVSVDVAIDSVRKAVQAGILNDLGSGSHVDLCVIERSGVRQWRERLVQSSPTQQDGNSTAANADAENAERRSGDEPKKGPRSALFRRASADRRQFVVVKRVDNV